MPLYDPKSDKPYKLSRSRIENFSKCKRCFYLEEKLGVKKPDSFPFNLNNAVDQLLKDEFDSYRGTENNHPYLIESSIDAKPYDHPDIEIWRTRNQGIGIEFKELNLYIYGLVDDVWINTKNDKLIIADYKATSKKGDVTIDAPWQISYKRQIEIYQWLFRQNGFDVDDMSYFVYCNGIKDSKVFDNCLNFEVKILPYKANDSWVTPALKDIKNCLNSDELPEESDRCDYCAYNRKIKLFG